MLNVAITCKRLQSRYTGLVSETAGNEIGVSKDSVADDRRMAVFSRPYAECLQWSGLGEGALAHAGSHGRRYANLAMCLASRLASGAGFLTPSVEVAMRPEALARPEQTQSTPAVDAKNLREAIQNIDALSQDGFSEIAAIAGLALSRLEMPEGLLHLEDVAYALQAIRGKAQDTKNCINGEAESVGCNYTDAAVQRRFDARRATEAMRREQLRLCEHKQQVQQ